MVLAGREARVDPEGAPARARPARRALEGLGVPFHAPCPRACPVCVREGLCAASGGRAPTEPWEGVAGFASFVHCLGGPKSLGVSDFLFFLFSAEWEKKTLTLSTPFLYKKVCKVCKVCSALFISPHRLYT